MRQNTKKIPLTEHEKIRTAAMLFQNRGDRPAVFLPDAGFYEELEGSQGLATAARRLCRWLQIDPVGLQARWVQAPDAALHLTADQKTCVMEIDDAYSSRPYQAGMLLAYGAVRYGLAERGYQLGANQAEELKFTDLCLAYSGLGLLVLNGIGYHEGWVDGLLRRIKRLLRPNNRLQTGYYRRKDFAGFVQDYAQRRRADLQEVARYVMPWARPWLPMHLASVANGQPGRPYHVARAEAMIRLHNRRTLYVLAGTCAALLLGAYTVLRSPQPPQELIDRQEKLMVLRTMHQACAESVAEKKASTDQSDLLTEGAVNAHASRCHSLRNRYNYELEQFTSAWEAYHR